MDTREFIDLHELNMEFKQVPSRPDMPYRLEEIEAVQHFECAVTALGRTVTFYTSIHAKGMKPDLELLMIGLRERALILDSHPSYPNWKQAVNIHPNQDEQDLHKIFLAWCQQTDDLEHLLGTEYQALLHRLSYRDYPIRQLLLMQGDHWITVLPEFQLPYCLENKKRLLKLQAEDEAQRRAFEEFVDDLSVSFICNTTRRIPECLEGTSGFLRIDNYRCVLINYDDNRKVTIDWLHETGDRPNLVYVMRRIAEEAKYLNKANGAGDWWVKRGFAETRNEDIKLTTHHAWKQRVEAIRHLLGDSKFGVLLNRAA